MSCAVDFYLLPDESEQSLLDYSCKLARGFCQQQQRVLIKTADKTMSQAIDEALWTYDPLSFIPHAISCDNDNDEQAILISHRGEESGLFDVQINLSNTAANAEQSPRIIEILNQQETRKQAGREHYKYYRQMQCELKHHELAASDL